MQIPIDNPLSFYGICITPAQWRIKCFCRLSLITLVKKHTEIVNNDKLPTPRNSLNIIIEADIRLTTTNMCILALTATMAGKEWAARR